MTQRDADWRWLQPAGLGFFLVFVFGLTAARLWVSVDAWAASVQAWRIAETGSPWLEDLKTMENLQRSFIDTAPNGHVVAHRMAGPVLLGIPFYALLQIGDDASAFALFPAGIGAAVATAGTVVLMHSAVQRITGQGQIALWVSLAFGLATPTWSVSADALWTHTVTQLGLAGAACAAARDRLGWAGIALGLAMLGRPHVALIAAVLGVGMAIVQRSVRPVLAIGLPTVAALGLLTLWNRWMFGQFSIGGGYTGSAQAAVSTSQDPWENLLGFLLSPDRGLVVWSPLLLLLLPLVIRTWSIAPPWSRCLVIGGLLYTFMQLRLNYFAGGAGFYGYRHGLELLTCSIPVLALAVLRLRPTWQALAVAVAGIQFAAISLGAVTESYLLDLEDVWRDNSYLYALRTKPAFAIPWTLISMALPLLIWQRSHRWLRPAKRTTGGRNVSA